MSSKPLHRSLVLWVAAIATAWTTLVAASLEWNLTEHQRIIDALLKATGRSPDPRDGQYLDLSSIDLPLDRVELAAHATTWTVGMLALGAAALFLRNRRTEQDRVASTLRQSEERFRALVEQAGDGFELIDADGRLVDVNDATCQQLGYSRDELIGLSLPDIDPDVTIELYAVRLDRMKGQAGITFETRHRRKDGTVFPVEVTTSAIRAGDRHYALSLVRDITERRRAAEAIKESDLRYRFLFDNMRDGLAYCRMIFEQDRPTDFIYLAVNPAFTSLTGLTGVVGKKVSEVIPGIRESDPKLLDAYGRVARTGVPEQFEIFVDAMKMWFAISVYSPSRDHFVAVFEVITDRKRTEEDLRLSQQRLALHIQQTPLAVIEFDLEGRVQEWNPSAAQVFGYSREEAIGQHWTFIVPRTVWDSLEGVWEGIVTRRGGSRSTNDNRTKDGRTISCEWFNTPLVDPKGAAMGVASLVMDVTDRTRAERQVERLKNHLASVIDSMPSMLVGIDRSGRVTQWNRQAEIDTGIRAFDALHQPVSTVLPDFAHSIDTLRMDLSRVVPASVQGVPVDRNGERRLFDVMLYPLAADSLEDVVVRIEDVTARSREQGLLLQIEKMTSVGGLAAGLAHEINNPLGIITQAIQNVEQRTSPNLPANRAAAATAGVDLEAVCAYHELREIPAFLEDIREAAGRAAHIVANMLAFSRTGETTRVPSDLSQLIEHSVLLAASDLELGKRYSFRGIDIVRQYATDVPAVPVARIEIEQVFLNLLTNAAHAVSANPSGRGPQIVLRLFREAKYAVAQILDNGPGMTPATQRRVFEPFFTTKPPGMGTGLGLSVAYTIVTHNHRGLIEVDSSPDHGTRFTVRLPLGDGDDAIRPAQDPGHGP